MRPKWCAVQRYGYQAISFLLKLRKVLPRYCLHTFLLTCTRLTHVHVRRDAHAPPLTRPYDSPYKVTQRTSKHFALEVNGKIKEY